MRRLLAPIIFALLLCARPASAAPGAGRFAAGVAVVREMNLARQHPEIYAGYLEELRGRFRGNIRLLSDHRMLRTREGVRAVDEAIRFLRRVRPLDPLAFSPGISLAAAEHAADQADGSLGHRGSDWSSPGDRLNRYGIWGGRWGENISYGKSSAREIVIALIIDDGQRARKHRKNIFNPAFNFAGAALGAHARYGTVCSIDFAGDYVDVLRAAL